MALPSYTFHFTALLTLLGRKYEINVTREKGKEWRQILYEITSLVTSVFGLLGHVSFRHIR